MTDWNEHEDAIDDAISDSIDMDWTSRTGAKAVVAWLNENAPSMNRDAEHTPSPQSVVVPVEPTEAMIEAFYHAEGPAGPDRVVSWSVATAMARGNVFRHLDDIFANAYRSMLSAAPSPSSLAGGEDSAFKVATDLHSAYEALIYGLPKYLEAENLTDEESMIREAWIKLDVTAHRLSALSPEAPAREGAIASIMAERTRQVDVEGWTPDHDDEHDDYSLGLAAASYAGGVDCGSKIVTYTDDVSGGRGETPVWGKRKKRVPVPWPAAWDARWWKPTGDRRRDLVKAGALIVAEIERLDRKAAQ